MALVSALVAGISLAFSMQRASEEDQSELRSNLTTIVRRLTVLSHTKDTPADANELAALLAEAKAILPELDSVPAVYYAELSGAFRDGLYYEDSLEFADKALRQATDDDDLVQMISARSYKGSTYVAIGDLQNARSQYSQAVALSDKVRKGQPDYVAIARFKITTLRQWGISEARLGACDRAATLFDSGLRLAKSIASDRVGSIESDRDSALKSCTPAESPGASARRER